MPTQSDRCGEANFRLPVSRGNHTDRICHRGLHLLPRPQTFVALYFQSIAAQVAQALRDEIASRTWDRSLPGERQLAERFQVSRKTIRKALAELRGDG